MIIGYLYAKAVQKLRFYALKNSMFHKTCRIGSGCNIINSTMNRYSYCGHDCEIINSAIGGFCSISDHVYIGGEEHPTNWVSTSSVFQDVKHSGSKKRFARHVLPSVKQTIIGSDVWIGHAVTIKQGVTVGHGAVIGSNALVTKDVPPYAVVGGVPAKILKYRFDEQTIQELLNCRWWEKSDEQITECSHLIKDPINFIKRINKLG